MPQSRLPQSRLPETGLRQSRLPETGRSRARARRLTVTLTTTVVAFGSLVGLATPAFAAGPFTAGDVVVYRVGTPTTTLASGTGAQVSLDEYSPTGTLVQSVVLPTTTVGSEKSLVASGTATSEGMLTLSADGQYLLATGYDAALGATGLTSTSSTTVPRTVGRVDANGNVDTSTALTDFATGNNPRSATSSDGTSIWVGGAAGGVRHTTLGSSTSTQLNSTDTNVREVSIADGQLYASADPTKAGALTIATVGSGEPTTGAQTVTNLPGLASSTLEPYEYVLVTLGTGTVPDTLYLADNTAGAIDKYGFDGTTWVAEGSVALSGVVGLTGSVTGGQATLYATTSTGSTGTLSKVVDGAGACASMAGTSTLLATAPTGEAFRGVAFAPVSLNTGNDLPETPLTVVLPLLAAAGLVAYVARRRVGMSRPS